MIFIYILLFFLIIFIFIYILVITYYYNISYLPNHIPDEIIKQGEGVGDISHFIRIREDINKYTVDIKYLDINIINIKQEISRLENTIEIQQLTIQTLRDEITKIEEALDDQINLETGRINLQDNLIPLYILLETDNYIKKYIYMNILQFTRKFIYVSVLYNKIKNANKKSILPILNNVNITFTYINNINNYMYNKISNDVYKFILISDINS
ncbi:unknown similar to AMEV137 [Choristoneura rosaceana entomopoxvirus 'L']|uniref:Uncharacterized protein n=1 Tax=Choristoneura rosaceana entomopoxvirus 'L' TaxID=1293539 RepID=A0ABM9QKI3_9POXV|nr:unknown similar to AMEV137 [Choristoneura rosaceana entomopoxvirus 'L']CCU56057.1 unknown similar to AMEV137 [Choristoneura rosaceana entomopoxvirus 'L']